MSVVSEISASSTIKKQEKKIVENLTKRTHFSSSEIERLLNLYRKTVVRTNPLYIYRNSSPSPTPNPNFQCFRFFELGSDNLILISGFIDNCSDTAGKQQQGEKYGQETIQTIPSFQL